MKCLLILKTFEREIGIFPAYPMTWDRHSYEFHIQMETSGRIDCGIFSKGLEVR